MKKVLSLFFVVSFCFQLNAQITINQSDFASIGTVLTLSDDTLPGNLILGNAGPNQTWDFSGINNHYTYTYTFIDVASSAYPTTFTNANMAIDISGQGYFFYLNSSPTSLMAVGQSGDFLGNGNNIALKINPPDVILQFPSTYQSSYTNVMGYDEVIYYNQVVSGFQVDSVRVKSVQNKTSVIDAWGNVITPEGTFPCVRQKTQNEVTDSVWGLINTGMSTMWVEFDVDYYIEDGYSWYGNNLGMPLVEVTYDTTNNVALQASWLLTALTYNENEETKNIIKEVSPVVFPNPVQDHVYINMSTEYENCAVSIIDAIGKNVKTQLFSNNEEIKIAINELKTGIYMLEIKIDNNKSINKKIVKE